MWARVSSRSGATTNGVWQGRVLLALVVSLVCGCGGGAEEAEDPSKLPKTPPPLIDADAIEPSTPADELERGLAGWPRATRSPLPLRAVPDADAALYRLCGQPERGLVTVAGRILDRRLDGHEPYSPRQLELLLRIVGVPQVWPRSWAVRGLDDEAELAQRLGAWVEREPAVGERRCGIARGADADGRPIVAVVTVDALADVNPLPTRVRPSQWIDLEATLHAPADEAHVLLLGPRGRPRKVLASLSDGRLRSRFSLDASGPWLVQVLATLPSGPTPVLEARMFAGVSPPRMLVDPPAPGRAPAVGTSASPAELARALTRLLNSARRSERLRPLTPDGRLAALARDHAAAMADQGRLAHDLGHGTVDQRLQAAGWRAVHVGENVAAARSIVRAHHALWASPSHRNNALDPNFARVGVGVAADAEGTLWVAQIFSE